MESRVFVLEHHNNPRRPLTQERLEQEAMVALNGPAEVHCDSIVVEALASFWRKQKVAGNRDGYLIRRSSKINLYFSSEAMDTIVKKTPKFLSRSSVFFCGLLVNMFLSFPKYILKHVFINFHKKYK